MRENNFDLIRLLAAFQVVIFHGIEHLNLRESIPAWLYELIAVFPGVPIFFFISGFLISAAYLRSTSLRQFTTNRLLRIFPGLWMCFAVAIASVLIFSPSSLLNANPTDIVVWFFAQLSIGQFFNPEFLRDYGVGVLNGSLWTIPVELQFYCSVPLLLMLLKNKVLSKTVIGWVLLLLTIVFLLINQAFNTGMLFDGRTTAYKLFAVSFVPYFWMFLVGVLVQLNFEKLERFFTGNAALWAIIHAACVLLLISFGQTPGTNFPHPLAAFTLSALVLSSAFTRKHLANKLLKKNDISYGIYIYHMIVVNIFIQINWTGSLAYLVLLLVSTAILGLMSWVFIERPNLAKQTFLAKLLKA